MYVLFNILFAICGRILSLVFSFFSLFSFLCRHLFLSFFSSCSMQWVRNCGSHEEKSRAFKAKISHSRVHEFSSECRHNEQTKFIEIEMRASYAFLPSSRNDLFQERWIFLATTTKKSMPRACKWWTKRRERDTDEKKITNFWSEKNKGFLFSTLKLLTTKWFCIGQKSLFFLQYQLLNITYFFSGSMMKHMEYEAKKRSLVRLVAHNFAIQRRLNSIRFEE